MCARRFTLELMVRILAEKVKALRSLRTMLFAMLNSFSATWADPLALLWAFVLFVFSVIFDMAISYSYDSMDPSSSGDRAEVERYFVLFAFYVGLSSVGVLNVVTGIFVDSAVCTRTEDSVELRLRDFRARDEVVESWTEDQKRTAEEVRCRVIQGDMSGSMTYRELENHLQNPWVKAYFSGGSSADQLLPEAALAIAFPDRSGETRTKMLDQSSSQKRVPGMDIDASEAAIIFTLMDSDRDNADCLQCKEVTIDEFVDGTMKLKGHAKSIDILSVMYDNAKFQAKFSIFCSHVEDQLVDMKNLITPGAGDKMERMYRPANQQVDYVKCFNKLLGRVRLRTADLGQTAECSETSCARWWLPFSSAAAFQEAVSRLPERQQDRVMQEPLRKRARFLSFVQRVAAKGPVYENCRILAPDGQILCTVDKKKLNWYVRRGLARFEDGLTDCIRLLFEPRGRFGIRKELGSSANVPDEHMQQRERFYTSAKENRCVVCGSDVHLARYNLVPSCFRSFLPTSHQPGSHDVLLLCVPCHHKASTEHGQQIKESLAKEVDVGIPKATPTKSDPRRRAAICASGLLKGGDNVPWPRAEVVFQRILRAWELGDDLSCLEAEVAADVGFSCYERAFQQKAPMLITRLEGRWPGATKAPSAELEF
ncbi:Exonuclease 3'-5' domain-containing protein 2 [Symbiodinium microadriaticum]|uniref:Exonuclease 3'-5' domain-containing protein 2 n=1 Tax=Symbiodinium microadriaticum TaxID=2951 RepID=A0A1Q9C6G2_SYMMI|nr:Exonuclease 3'-5' domain-containing protein 2 [Symbiodinium microadriaticum]